MDIIDQTIQYIESKIVSCSLETIKGPYCVDKITKWIDKYDNVIKKSVFCTASGYNVSISYDLIEENETRTVIFIAFEDEKHCRKTMKVENSIGLVTYLNDNGIETWIEYDEDDGHTIIYKKVSNIGVIIDLRHIPKTKDIPFYNKE